LFNAYAGMLGLNIDRFKKDMESDQVKSRVSSDEKRANEIGVTNTPTVFINNRAVAPPSLNDAGLRSTIKEAGAQSKEKPK
jgi:predicted DsbA family dithiol-disulfide isomerase